MLPTTQCSYTAIAFHLLCVCAPKGDCMCASPADISMCMYTPPSTHTGRSNSGTQVCTHPSSTQAEATAVWRAHTCTPRAVLLQRSPLPQPRVFCCNSCIPGAVLCIGRSFPNTPGLFTKLCKNILSLLQLSLPQGAGTCPAQRRASCAFANSAPGLLKGQLGTPQRRTVGLGQRPAGQLLPSQWLLAPHARSLVMKL